MSLLDASFLTVTGEPILGRTPVTLVVHGSALTQQQRGWLQQYFSNFKTATRISVNPGTGFWNGRLPDGSVVLMQTFLGNDTVQVWTRQEPAHRLESLLIAAPATFRFLYTPAAPRLSQQGLFRGRTSPPSLKPTRIITDAIGILQHPGNLTWWSDSIKFNGRPAIVSWYGKASRYGRADYYGIGRQYASATKQDDLYGPQDDAADARTNWQDAFKPAVWTNGIKHAVRMIVDDAPVDVLVMSAGMKKDEDGLWLWLVGCEESSDQFTVYKGKIDPYSTSAVTVEEVFDIDYRIDTATYSGGQPWWEAPLQPFYFNAGCTKCASLVVASTTSSTNASAAAAFSGLTLPGGFPYCVAVAEVDLALMTTTFTADHLTNTREQAGTTTPDGSFDVGGTNDYTDTTVVQHYGAVDYVIDVLTIAIVENKTVFGYLDVGGFNYISHDSGLGVSDFVRDITNEYTFSYRVFLYGTATELANKTFTTVSLSTLHGEGDTSYSFPLRGVGTHDYAQTDPIGLHAHIEGGDLRHDGLIVSELLDIGTVNVSETFDIFNDYTTVLNFAYASNTKQRQPARRLRVWKDGTIIETGGARKVYGSGVNTMGAVQLPLHYFGDGSTYLSGGFGWYAFTPISDSDVTADGMRFFWAGSGSYLNAEFHVGGYPYVNTCAFATTSTDADETESQWCYSVAEFMDDGIAAPSTFNAVTAFVIAGTKHVKDPGDYMPDWTPDDAVLASPVFLDNVPTE